MIPAQTDNTTNYVESEKLKDSEEENDDNGAGVEQENRKQKITGKEFIKYSVK